MNLKEIANKLVLNLNECGVGCYLYHEASRGNSFYIRFNDARIGSLRISDHNSREAYTYKYEVRSDIEHEGKWIKNSQWQFLIGAKHWEKLVDVLIGRADFVKDWKQREYYTPKHKTRKTK